MNKLWKEQGSQSRHKGIEIMLPYLRGECKFVPSRSDMSRLTLYRSIADFSLAVQVLKGRALVYVFGTWPLVKTWRKIVVPLSAAEWIERAKREKGFRSHLVYE